MKRLKFLSLLTTLPLVSAVTTAKQVTEKDESLTFFDIQDEARSADHHPYAITYALLALPNGKYAEVSVGEGSNEHTRRSMYDRYYSDYIELGLFKRHFSKVNHKWELQPIIFGQLIYTFIPIPAKLQCWSRSAGKEGKIAQHLTWFFHPKRRDQVEATAINIIRKLR